MMHLATIPNMVGGHLGGWRHPDAFEDSVMNLDAVVEMAQTAERGKFDAVFLADGNGVREMERPALFAANFPSARPAMFEPTTPLSAIAMVTRRIGLVATATSTFEEPWMVARRFSSMDHISRGRAGWNLVTASNPAAGRRGPGRARAAAARTVPHGVRRHDAAGAPGPAGRAQPVGGVTAVPETLDLAHTITSRF